MRAMFAKWGGPLALVEAARAGSQEIPGPLRTALCSAREHGRRVAKQCAERGIDILLRGSSDWPEAIECLGDVPEVLFTKGRVSTLLENAVAIVGSRESSSHGDEFAFQLAARLAMEGWATVSGLARGIDRAAHEGSLSAGGETIAVLGCGADIVFPEENRALQERIAEEGLIVSEFAPGMPPVPGNFPRRNRILSALAQAVVLVECRRRSGALITCRHALDQGRELFVVPGWPTSPYSAGPLQLLRDGARAIRDVDDLLEDLRGIGAESRQGALFDAPVDGGDSSARSDGGDSPLDSSMDREERARRELLAPMRSPFHAR
jgi:DNA processing protein